ncbi:MAG: thiamine/thiamine pyrophosphate ABC transporter permease ThiP, partial [Alphaproteobacteria bacterium]|nr:thiamine/thiamine pyrophosphate ABC transporter permease ThiP [Alphaproteobacteria bacterium]
MAPGNRNLSSLIAGSIGLAGLAIVMAGAIGALTLTAVTTPGGGLWDDYLWRVVRFTLWQAGLSTVLSIGLAIPVARAIARRRVFPGRGPLLRLFALPLALPALVVVLGIVDVWGRHGWAAVGLTLLGF